LQLAAANRLAYDSGARTDFSADERNKLDGVGEKVNQDDEPADSSSWLERAVDGFSHAVSNTGSWLFDNPVTHGLMDVLDGIGNAIHYPFRLASDALDTSNNDEIDHQMEAAGYDPDSTTSYLAFAWQQGESMYHDLSGIVETYGEDMVDEIAKFQRDPEAWVAELEKMPEDEQQKLIDRTNSADWVKAADLMSRASISPGRDLARILTLGHTDNAWFTAISGSLDAAYSWFLDPTLILGKSMRAIRTFDVLGRDIESAGALGKLNRKVVASIPYLANKRAGLQGTVDQAGIEALLRVDPKTGRR
jgi:hypothetical protein